MARAEYRLRVDDDRYGHMAGVSRAKGGSYGRPQPQDHPWRKAEKLRLARIAA